MSKKISLPTICITFVLTLSACGSPQNFFSGPGHNAFKTQLAHQSTSAIMSVQGYLIKDKNEALRLRQVWKEMANLMNSKPGYIEASLNPGLGKSKLWIEISKWENATSLRSAYEDPKVQEIAKKLPKIGMSHLFAISEGTLAIPSMNTAQ